MCVYIRTVPLCGHPPPTIFAYTNCSKLLAQLTRITEPEAWAIPEARNQIPFELPDDCEPGPNNIWTVYSDDYCGWECRNNALIGKALSAAVEGSGTDDEDDSTITDLVTVMNRGVKDGKLPAYMPDDERGQFPTGNGAHCPQPMVMGMIDGNYGPGSERLGIGWREVV